MINAEWFDRIPKFSEFTYWFQYRGYNRVKTIHNGITIHADIVDGSLHFTNCDGVDITTSDYIAMSESWERFKKRPEYFVMIPSNIGLDSQYEYEIRLIGSAFIKEYNAGKDPDLLFPKVLQCIEWLRSTDFYTTPASTKYHDCEEGGLMNHSLRVANLCLDLMKARIFSTVKIESAVLTSLVHDWCKIGSYVSYYRNVKNETTGAWEKVKSYNYAEERQTCFGHGVSSMILAKKYFKLNTEELLAIRWHMGEYNVAESETFELSQANNTYPLVQLLQFADRLSLTKFCI